MSFEDFASSGPLQMTAEDARKIFETKIVPSIGAKGRAPEHPTLIVVAGQPGSGKSTAIRNAEMGLSGATQRIIGDDFDAFVPGHHALARDRPADAAACARQAGSGSFTLETLKRAEGMRANVILELAVPTASAQYAARYRQLGYRSELHIVATPRYQSWTGVLDRAEKALSNGHIGTNVLVPRNAHDQTYSGWARAVFDAEQQMQFDRIVITRRDGAVMYDNHLEQRDGTTNWAKPMRALETLLQERHRAVSEVEATRSKEAWDRIVQSEPMKSDVALRALPLEHYRKEVVDFVGSEASRITLATRAPGQFSLDAVKQRQRQIIKDLNFATSSGGFGYSAEFDRRARKYGAAITDVAKQYIPNFSIPTGALRTGFQFDLTGTGASLAPNDREAISNQAKPATLDQFTKRYDKARAAARLLKQRFKEFFDKSFGSRQEAVEPAVRDDTSNGNGGQVKRRNIAGQISRWQGRGQELAAAPKIARDRGLGALAPNAQRQFDPRDRSGRSR